MIRFRKLQAQIDPINSVKDLTAEKFYMMHILPVIDSARHADYKAKYNENKNVLDNH